MKKLINKKGIKRMFNGGKFTVKVNPMSENYVIPESSIVDTRVLIDGRANAKRIIFAIITFLLSVFFQEALFNNLRLFGVKPNLGLVVLLIFACSSNPDFALVMGLVAGIFMDVVYGKYYGFYGLLYMHFATISAFLCRPKMKSRPYAVALCLPGILTIYAFLQSFLSRVMIIYSAEHTVLYENFGRHLIKKLFPELLYNLIVAAILVIPLTAIWMKFGVKKDTDNKIFDK